MPEIAPFHPGARAYGRVVFTRSAYESDDATTTTATVTLVNPEGTEVTGIWTAVIQTATALIAHDESTFRVLRATT
jgi:hypothetical protein